MIVQGHRELFSDDILMPFTEGLNILSDEQRIHAVCINLIKFNLP